MYRIPIYRVELVRDRVELVRDGSQLVPSKQIASPKDTYDVLRPVWKYAAAQRDANAQLQQDAEAEGLNAL